MSTSAGVSGKLKTGISGGNVVGNELVETTGLGGSHGDRRRGRGGKTIMLWRRQAEFRGGNGDAALVGTAELPPAADLAADERRGARGIWLCVRGTLS